LQEELDEIAISLYKEENPEHEDTFVVYSRLSNWKYFGIPIWIGIISIKGGKYRRYEDEIKKVDRLLLLGIMRKHFPENPKFVLNTVAFSFQNQKKLWDAVFKVKKKPKEKRKQIRWLRQLIHETLSQLTLEDLFGDVKEVEV